MTAKCRNVPERSSAFEVIFEPEEYLIKVKSEESCSLLTSGKNSISSIARRCPHFQEFRARTPSHKYTVIGTSQ